MEYLEVKKLRENWGGKPCDHPKFEREYYGDTFTLDYACNQCGAEFNLLEMLEAKHKKRRLKKELTLHS